MQVTHPPSVRELFEAALAVPAETRALFLLERCADAVTRERVARLLAAHETDEGILDIPSSVVAETLLPALANASDWLGREVGGIRLIEFLGQGGSAVVFKGQKTRHEVTQFVAVKLLRHFLLTQADVRRFRQERAAMARLTHPNIARLIDGGTTKSGVAYIVLEFVDGQRITEHAQHNALGLRDRVRLMIDVCRAVDAAHRAFIVHRDLKPSNVLVTNEGYVKLLDFGIAKFLSTEEDATETGYGALTPAYAAPEQFLGGVVTTATDVYSLGVLLGELLTGRRSSADPRATVEASRVDVDVDADAEPTTAVSEVARNEVRGDIENILLKATAADAELRYLTAGALADDLQRFLESRPVLAHPPSRRYRLRKFYARHRLVVFITSFLCGLILAAVAAAVWQAHVATLQRERAQTEAALARATRDFMVDIFRMAEPAGPRAAPASVVDVAEAALNRLSGDAAMHPRVRLDLKTQLGTVLRGQSKLDRAVQVLQETQAEGIAAFGANDALVVDAGIEFIRTLVAAERYDEAAAALPALKAPAWAQQGDRKVEYELVASKIASTFGNEPGTLSHVAAARAACDAQCSDESRFNLLVSEANASGVFQREEAAVAAWEKAAVLAKKIHSPVHASVTTALNGLAGAYRRAGRFEDARRVIREVIDIDDRIQLPALHWRRALHLNQLGNIHYSLRDYGAALEALQRALEITRALSGDVETLAVDLQSIGVVYSRLGQLDRAVEYLRESVRRRDAFAGEHGRNAAFSRSVLAHMLALNGDLDAALPLFERAVRDLSAAGDGSRTWLFGAMRTQARVLIWAGRPEQALATIDQALAIDGQSPGLEADHMSARVTRGVALVRAGRSEEAVVELDQSLQRLGLLKADYHSQAYAAFALGLVAAGSRQCAVATERMTEGRAALAREPFAFVYLRTSEAELNAALSERCGQLR